MLHEITNFCFEYISIPRNLGITLLSIIAVSHTISACGPKFPEKYQRPKQYYVGYGSEEYVRNCHKAKGVGELKFHSNVAKELAESLAFDKGDVIRCFIGPAGFHFMLATNTRDVIHITGVASKRHIATLKEESVSRAAGKYGSNCEVYTDCMDCDMILGGVTTPRSNNAAIARARSSMESFADKEVYYNLLHCNCEHWVAYWKYGKALSIQGQWGWKGGKTDGRCSV